MPAFMMLCVAHVYQILICIFAFVDSLFFPKPHSTPVEEHCHILSVSNYCEFKSSFIWSYYTCIHTHYRYPLELYLTILFFTHKHVSSWTLSSYPCLHTHSQVKRHPIILTFTHKHTSNRTLSYYSCFNMKNTYPAEHSLTILIFTHRHKGGENNRWME